MGIVITIDGGAGTGTTSVSQTVAELLGQTPLNTGHLYRSLAWACREAGIRIDSKSGVDFADWPAVVEVARTLDLEIKHGSVVEVNGFAVDETILSNMTPFVPHVSRIADARPHIRRHQLGYADLHPCVIAEGRDLGTVVFPDALRKVFLVCEDIERAKRRSNHEGHRITVPELLERDRMDAERDCSPMVPHPTAMIVDTTHTDIPTLAHNIIVSLIGVPRARRLIAPYVTTLVA